MKHISVFFTLVLIMILTVLSLAASAEDQQNVSTDKWTVFQLAFVPTFPESQDTNDVYGLKFGLPVSSGPKTVDGLELSVIGNGTAYINGFQIAAMANLAKKINGSQIALVNCVSEDSASVNIGLINVAYFNTSGMQLGAFNMTGKETKGVQLGCYNFSEIQSDGAQIGILNITGKKGFQFGLINIIKDSFLPCLPFVNYY